MKTKQSLSTLAVVATCSILPSCGLIQSAVKVPGSILKSVGRTVGMPVNHTEKDNSEKPAIEVIGDGYIEQHD